MKRSNWLEGLARKIVDWDAIHSHALNTYAQSINILPRTRQNIENWGNAAQDQGYIFIRKFAGISPNDLVPIGSILLWNGGLGTIPDGWEEAREFRANAN